MKKEPKYQKNTKITVCQDLKTQIDDIEYSEEYQEYIYWFKDENGKLWHAAECDVEMTYP